MTGNTIQARAEAFVSAYVDRVLDLSTQGGQLHRELVKGATMAMLIDQASEASNLFGELQASEEERGQLEADNETLRRRIERMQAELVSLRAWQEASIDFVAHVHESGVMRQAVGQ